MQAVSIVIEVRMQRILIHVDVGIGHRKHHAGQIEPHHGWKNQPRVSSNK